jgi:hypothetical protein
MVADLHIRYEYLETTVNLLRDPTIVLAYEGFPPWISYT